MDSIMIDAGVPLAEAAASSDVGAGVLATIWSVIYDTWVEAFIIATALYLYVAVVQGQPSILWWMGGTRAKKSAKAASLADKLPPCSGPAFPEGAPSVRGTAQTRGRGAGGAGQDSKVLEVQRLVISLLRKGSSAAEGPQAMAQYDRLVRGEQLDLRRHISDDQARSLYIALVECGVRVAGGGEANPASRASPSDLAVGGSNSLSAKASTVKFLKDMQAFGFPRGHEFFAAILKCHINSKMLEDALWLYDAMVADGVTPDRSMYVGLVSAAIALNQDQKAISFFREICKTGPPSMRTYMTVLKIYGKNRDWRGASDLLDSLRGSAAPDALVLNTVLGLCVSAFQLAAAERCLNNWEECADTVSCNILLKGYAQQANLPKADKLLEKMLRSGPVPNIITFNTIMDCAVRAIQAAAPGGVASPSSVAAARVPVGFAAASSAEQDGTPHREAAGGQRKHVHLAAASRPWQLLDQLLELGLRPDRYTCSTLVKGMHLGGCTPRDIDRSVQLLQRVGPEGLHTPGQVGGSSEACNAKLSEVLFNTLLDACVSARDLDRMVHIFGMMQSFKVEVSAVTFGTLIKAFGQAKKLQRCHEVWENMQAAKVKPTVVTYGCYIDVCARNGDMEEAERILASMSEGGIKPNSVIYTSLIRGCAMTKQPLKALHMYKEMQRRGIAATAVTFNSVLDVVARQSWEPEKLQEVIEDMKAASVQPDMVTCSILVKASCNAGNVRTAISLFRKFRADGLEFDEVAFNTLLLACAKADKVAEAEEMFQEMLGLGVCPTHVTTSILVKMYGKAKMLDKAIEVSRMVERKYGAKPNLYVYTCLIQACVRNQHVRRSWDIFARMLRSGTLPDAVTYGTLIHGCIYHNKFEQAVALVRHAYVLPAPDGKSVFQALGVQVGASDEGQLALERQRPLVLQSDVLMTLTVALRRKGHLSLAQEMEAIGGESAKAMPSWERTPASYQGRNPASRKPSWSSAAGSPVPPTYSQQAQVFGNVSP